MTLQKDKYVYSGYDYLMIHLGDDQKYKSIYPIDTILQ